MNRVADWWREGHPVLPMSWTHTSGGYDLTWLGRAVNVWHKHTRWFRWSWWSYIWRAPQHWRKTRDPRKPYEYYRSWQRLNRWTVRFCRLRGHPGIVYWNAGGLEPDTSCKRCGEEIG